ncbi:hypothetical protein KKG81_13960, partial [bacterium]|nr:hypothetical protein [bacterium]
EVLRDLKDEHIRTLENIKHAVDHNEPEVLTPNKKECKNCFYNYYPNGCSKSPKIPKEKKPLNTSEKIDKLKEEVKKRLFFEKYLERRNNLQSINIVFVSNYFISIQMQH